MVKLDRAAFEAPTALSEKLSGNEHSIQQVTTLFSLSSSFIQYMACEHEIINKVDNALDYESAYTGLVRS